MPLQEEFALSGAWLFRRRSYLPLVLLALVLAQLPHFQYLGGSRRFDQIWVLVCLCIAAAGVAVRVLTVGYAPRGTSGRTTRSPEASQLVTSGMYSVVRHPLYVGNLLIWVGVAAVLHTWWLVVLIVLVWTLYHERIMFAEEELLRRQFGDAFVEWASRTPAFIPNLRLWRTPDIPFSARSALGREYHLLPAIVGSFLVLVVAGDWVVSRRLILDPIWVVLLSASVVAYLALRFLKLRTGLLSPADR
jgi:protein-S-isoprenylcysteine O-methyltransferase Ste14